ncbi:hypothetical protein YC2023_018192 [Brassica napus]
MLSLVLPITFEQYTPPETSFICLLLAKQCLPPNTCLIHSYRPTYEGTDPAIVSTFMVVLCALPCRRGHGWPKLPSGRRGHVYPMSFPKPQQSDFDGVRDSSWLSNRNQNSERERERERCKRERARHGREREIQWWLSPSLPLSGVKLQKALGILNRLESLRLAVDDEKVEDENEDKTPPGNMTGLHI